jgi:hypothetical protein
MKSSYKELRKNLKNRFYKEPKGYEIRGSVGVWCKQCDINPTPKTLKIICLIFGSVPYCYQESDRTKILKYLKTHKYKDFKNEYLK